LSKAFKWSETLKPTCRIIIDNNIINASLRKVCFGVPFFLIIAIVHVKVFHATIKSSRTELVLLIGFMLAIFDIYSGYLVRKNVKLIP